MFKVKFYIFLLMLMSCHSENSEYVVTIDNSSLEQIHVSLDQDETVIIEPKSSKDLVVKPGLRKIFVDNNQVGEVNLDLNKNYLLSPLKNTYLIRTVHYFSSEEEKEKFKAENKGNKEESVHGRLDRIGDQMLIEKSWDIGIDSPLPDPPTLKEGDSNVDVTKMYRLNDWLSYVFENVDLDELKKQKERNN